MRSALSTLEVLQPKSLDQALKALSAPSTDGRLVPLAGGTDLFVYLNAGAETGARFLDLWGLRELRGVRAGKSGVTLGALTTFRDLRQHPMLRRRFPALAAAAAEIGAWQIQNRATLAGNIANASPAGDSLPALMSYDAVVCASSVRGPREVAFESLYRGYRDLALERDELIVAVRLPDPPPRAFHFFRKVGTRRAQSISKVVFAGVLARDREGRVSHARLSFGSVAPVTLRARRAEEALAGRSPRPEAAVHARAALAEDLAPIDDIRSSREYRLAVAGNLLDQFLRAADRGYVRA